MSNNADGHLLPSPRLPVSGQPMEGFRGQKAALALGLVGAGVAAVFLCARWSIGLVCGITILALSAAESEPFLLFLVFLLPIGWFVSLGTLTVPYSRLDVATATHLLATGGFFGGRLWRSRLPARALWGLPISRASGVLTAAILLSLVFGTTGWTRDSSRSLMFFGSYVGFYFLMLVWVDSRRRLRRVCGTLLLSTILVALFGILQEVVGGYTSLWLFLNPSDLPRDPWSGRATSFLSQANSLAGYLNLVLPFALACFVLGQGKWKKLAGGALGLGFLALLSSQSIGGLVSFLLVLVLGVLCFARNRRKGLALVAGICTLVCLLYVLRSMLNPAHPAHALGPDLVVRLLLWTTAWRYFIHSPWVGVGWGNFVGLYGSDLSSFSAWIHPGALEVHNIYLQFLAETGLVGFVAFLHLIIRSWRQASRQLRSSSDFLDSALAFGVLGALLSVLVHGLVDFLFQVSPQFGTLFWVLLALLVASGGMSSKSLMQRVGASGA
jgi:O-antigen ligase